MATLELSSQAHQIELVLPGFSPLHTLWEGDSPAFPSEYSARWAIKRQRLALIEAGAIAFHLGRTVVHRERLLQVLAASAVNSYKQRYAAASR